MTKNWLFLIMAMLTFSACENDYEVFGPLNDELNTEEQTTDVVTLNLPDELFNYANPDLPFFFNAPPIQGQLNTPANNPVTDEGATLGRVLFYDKNMSANNTVSCASCHQQEHGFSDPLAFSIGFEGEFTGRNSMGLAQAAYYANGRFFWDERAATLEVQTLMPIQDHIEMGMELDELEEKLSTLAYYPELFEQTFGDAQITSDRISSALAQFVRSMVSYTTKFDEGMAELVPGQNPGITPFSNYSELENLGKELFFSARTNCATCHGTTNFVAPGPRNNGLDLVFEDNGLGDVSGAPQQNGLFKVNSLRNIAMTAPYMHDGRFATLEEVIEHYNSGVQAHPNLSATLRVGGAGGPNNVVPRVLNLNDEEKLALRLFLETLTDEPMLNDEKFSDPFGE